MIVASKHLSFISSCKGRRASPAVSPALFFWTRLFFLCEFPLPYLCCCMVNDFLHSFCSPACKKQFESWRFHCTAIQADSSWFKYFCVWLTSPQTSHLIKDNSGGNSHMQQRAKSARIPLWITQLSKAGVNFSNVVWLHAQLQARQGFCLGKSFHCTSFCSIFHQWNDPEKNDYLFSKVPKNVTHGGDTPGGHTECQN